MEPVRTTRGERRAARILGEIVKYRDRKGPRRWLGFLKRVAARGAEDWSHRRKEHAWTDRTGPC